jgi:hypothetical protein
VFGRKDKLIDCLPAAPGSPLWASSLPNESNKTEIPVMKIRAILYIFAYLTIKKQKGLK